MKTNRIKILTVLTLVALTATIFALVACDKKTDNNPDNGPKTITFRLDYNDSANFEEMEVDKGSSYTLPDLSAADSSFKRGGFEFLGWSDKKTGGNILTSPITPEQDDIYYAQWQLAAPEITVFGDTEISWKDSLSLTASCEEYSGITYSFAWKFKDGDEISQTAAATVAELEMGGYQLEVTATATASNYAPRSTTKTISVAVGKASVAAAITGDRAAYTGQPIDFSSTLNITSDYDGGDYTLRFNGNDNPAAADLTLTEAGRYALDIVFAETEKFKRTEIAAYLRVCCIKINGYISTLEDLCESGGDAVLFADVTLKKSYILPQGATLVLPYDGSDVFEKFHALGDASAPIRYIDIARENDFLKRSLTIGEGCTLTVLGALKIGGVTGSPYTGAFQGATLGNYAQVNVSEGASLIIGDGGEVDTYGFIKGEGQLVAKSGAKLSAPFVVRDFRGGTSTLGAYADSDPFSAIVIDRFDMDRVCPFNQYEMPNIRIIQHIQAGADVFAHCNLYADAKFNTTDSKIIGTQKSLIKLLSGEIIINNTQAYHSDIGNDNDYARLPDRYESATQMDVYGDVEMGALELMINFKGILNVNVSTAYTYMPISYVYTINVKSGSSLTAAYPYKLMPGATLNIERGATFTITSATDAKGKTTNGMVIAYGGDFDDRTDGAGSAIYPNNKGEANLIINGELIVEAGGYFGGKIQTTENGATVSVDSAATLSLYCNEGHGPTQNPGYDKKYERFVTHTETQTARFADNSPAIEAGKTYTFNDGVWTAA